jgi:PAS domain S-box-containing protein
MRQPKTFQPSPTKLSPTKASPTKASTLKRSHDFFRSPLLLTAVLMLLVLAVLTYQMWQSRQDTIRHAESTTRSLTDLLEVRIASDFQRLDGLLGYAASEFASHRLLSLPNTERTERSKQLARLIANFPAVASVNVFDAEGLLQVSSQPDKNPFSIADRPHFQAMQNNTQVRTMFADPLLSRSTDKLAIVQSHAIRASDGRFLGMVNAIYHLETLTDQIASIDVGVHGVTLLRRSDNFKLIARYPRGNEAELNTTLPSNNPIRQRIANGIKQGFLQYRASTDGIQRIGSFRVLEDYPFYVQVAFAESDFLADWNRQALMLAAVFLGLGLPVFVILLRLERANASAMATATQLHSQQQRLEKLSQNIPGVIYQFQRWPDGRSAFPYASKAIREIYGVEPEQVREDASPIFALLDPDDLERIAQSIEESAATLTRWREVYRVNSPDGDTVWVEGEATPERLADDSVLWHGYIRNITDRKKLEQVRDQAKQAAEAANIAKSRFLATMSHEIRTPMNGILGMAQMLLRPELQLAERQDFARTILNSGQTLLNLLNDILDYSKIEAGKLELEYVVFEPGQLLQEMQSLFIETAHAKGLHLEAIWKGPAEAYFGDPHRLRQMLSNLIGNAIKFTAHGSVRIEATEVDHDGQSALLEFIISDTGIGISADKQALLFKPFSQADSSTTREFGGTGLGLSIVSNLTRLMGGDIGVESSVDNNEGQGSRFWFRIRAKMADTSQRRQQNQHDQQNQQDQLPAPLLQVVEQAPQALNGKLLVVEDNPTNQKVIRSMLNTLGLSCVIADDGQQAIDCIDHGAQFDLILMDVQMPIMDGYQATARIRQRESDLGEQRRCIIAITANAFAEDRARCLNAGMDDFLAKPINIKALAKVLQHWLAAPQAGACNNEIISHNKNIVAANTQPPTTALPDRSETNLSFDESALLKPLNGNRELAGLIMISAMHDFTNYFAQVEHACQASDWSAAKRPIHTMKGLATQLGGMRLAQLMQAADARLKAGEALDTDSLAALKTEYATLTAALQQWLKSSSRPSALDNPTDDV